MREKEGLGRAENESKKAMCKNVLRSVSSGEGYMGFIVFYCNLITFLTSEGFFFPE